MYDIPFYPGYKLTKNHTIIGKRGKPMSLCSNGHGHLYCNVFVNNSQILYLHRAIDLVHVPGYFEGVWVDHIDDNSKNNDPSNLRWVFPADNYYIKKGTSIFYVKYREKMLEFYKKELKKLKA